MGLLSMFTGGSNATQSSGGGGMTNMDTSMPQLGGVGAMLSPADQNYKGHFRDGDLILKAEEGNLEGYQLLVGESETEFNNSMNDLRAARTFYRNVKRSSDNRTQVVQLHNQTKAVVTGNHHRQFSSAVALKTAQMKTAGGYMIDQARLPVHQQRTMKKVQRVRQKLAENSQRRM